VPRVQQDVAQRVPHLFRRRQEPQMVALGEHRPRPPGDADSPHARTARRSPSSRARARPDRAPRRRGARGSPATSSARAETQGASTRARSSVRSRGRPARSGATARRIARAR
jgi:hypothetical protein